VVEDAAIVRAGDGAQFDASIVGLESLDLLGPLSEQSSCLSRIFQRRLPENPRLPTDLGA
jgi:hypothetical protein